MGSVETAELRMFLLFHKTTVTTYMTEIPTAAPAGSSPSTGDPDSRSAVPPMKKTTMRRTSQMLNHRGTKVSLEPRLLMRGRSSEGNLARLPNGLEMSRPASSSILHQTRFAAAGRVGSIELLGCRVIISVCEGFLLGTLER